MLFIVIAWLRFAIPWTTSGVITMSEPSSSSPVILELVKAIWGEKEGAGSRKKY